MNDRYFFDKRDWKKRFFKFGIIMLISFFPVVLMNFYLSNFIKQRWLMIFLDCIVLLVFFVLGNYLANKIFSRKEAKQERLRKEREELEKRKKQIMEDSYKRKRLEKEKKKELDNDEVVVEEETTEKIKVTKSTRSKK